MQISITTSLTNCRSNPLYSTERLLGMRAVRYKAYIHKVVLTLQAI
jgi:hypothetical protein